MKFINNPNEIIIFGSGESSEIIYKYASSNNINVKFFTDFNSEKKEILKVPFLEYELLKKDSFLRKIPIFVAIGYRELNSHRGEKILFLQKDNWTFANICCSEISEKEEKFKGGNIFVANNVSIQPFASIDYGTYIWDNCVIGHHSKIHENNWLTSGTVIGGHSEVGKNCFLGINTSVNHMINVGEKSFIGSSCLVSKDLQPQSVIIKKNDKIAEFKSDFFIRSGALK